jgi:hypothetical protein
VLGGVAAYFLTRDTGDDKRATLQGIPTIGVIDATPTAKGVVPAFGLSYAGVF